jgi:hypothetical protein
MSKSADELQALHTQLQMAKAAVAMASSALQTKGLAFAEVWASYSNSVRALTKDSALRAKHGVKSPGYLKGPAFHRAPKGAKPTTGNGKVPADAGIHNGGSVTQ